VRSPRGKAIGELRTRTDGCVMVNITNPAVLHCLEKAAECDRRGQEANDAHAREMYRRLAENWRSLSENHARMEAFLRNPNQQEPDTS